MINVISIRIKNVQPYKQLYWAPMVRVTNAEFSFSDQYIFKLNYLTCLLVVIQGQILFDECLSLLNFC